MESMYWIGLGAALISNKHAVNREKKLIALPYIACIYKLCTLCRRRERFVRSAGGGTQHLNTKLVNTCYSILCKAVLSSVVG